MNEKEYTPLPHRIAQFLIRQASNWQNVAIFILIVGLSIVSMVFTIRLGLLTGDSETESFLMASGYAMIDAAALVLFSCLALKIWPWLKSLVMGAWSLCLIALSFFAAATFSLGVDVGAVDKEIQTAIAIKEDSISKLSKQEGVWISNVENTDSYKTAYQDKLDKVQAKKNQEAAALAALQAKTTAKHLQIFKKLAEITGIAESKIRTFVRLIWSGAITLTPFVLSLVLMTNDRPTLQFEDDLTVRERAELWLKKRKLQKLKKQVLQKRPEVAEARPLQPVIVEAPKRVEESGSGNNQHTSLNNLKALKNTREWLAEREDGRVTRSQITKASGVWNRDTVTIIIEALIDEGVLQRLPNGQIKNNWNNLKAASS